MSNQQDKLKNSSRRHNDETATKRQVKIAKQHGMGFYDKVIKEPHRLSKHHAMDCGNPKCYLCGNPRRTHKDGLTIQEKKFLQDIESINNSTGNEPTSI